MNYTEGKILCKNYKQIPNSNCMHAEIFQKLYCKVHFDTKYINTFECTKYKDSLEDEQMEQICDKNIQLATEQHGFEVHMSIYT